MALTVSSLVKRREADGVVVFWPCRNCLGISTWSETGGSENLTRRLILLPESSATHFDCRTRLGMEPALLSMDPEGEAELGDGTNFCHGCQTAGLLTNSVFLWVFFGKISLI